MEATPHTVVRPSTQFSLLEGRIITRDGAPIFRVLDPAYADAIYDCLIGIARKRGVDTAVAAIAQLESRLTFKIRRTSEYDALEFSVAVHSKERAGKIGSKVFCSTCNKHHYDLNRGAPCPICAKASSIPASTSST